jgi:hypothetical protein
MRSSLTCLVAVILTLAGSTTSFAAHRGETNTSYDYSGCVCHFGYGGGDCKPDVACGSEGGRCGESCGFLPARDYSTR